MSIYVLFIGGFQSTQPDVEMWRASAAKQRGDVTFVAYAYPDINTSSDSGAVDGFRPQFEGAIKKLVDSGADTFFVVGHSSGCAIANELNSRLEVDHSKVTLVDLDGFAPRPKQIKQSSVQAWCAEGAGGKGKSLHWADYKQKFTSPSATTIWSLHFSLVNSTANDTITQANYRTKGYAGCIANLCWLPKKP